MPSWKYTQGTNTQNLTIVSLICYTYTVHNGIYSAHNEKIHDREAKSRCRHRIARQDNYYAGVEGRALDETQKTPVFRAACLLPGL